MTSSAMKFFRERAIPKVHDLLGADYPGAEVEVVTILTHGNTKYMKAETEEGTCYWKNNDPVWPEDICDEVECIKHASFCNFYHVIMHSADISLEIASGLPHLVRLRTTKDEIQIDQAVCFGFEVTVNKTDVSFSLTRAGVYDVAAPFVSGTVKDMFFA
jgi:hypothetical protein